MNGSRRVGATPMSAAATAAGTASIGIRPRNVDPLGDAQLVGQRPKRRFRVAAAVEVEAADRGRAARAAEPATARTATSTS